LERLAGYERAHENDSTGPLAALALGYHEYTHKRSTEAAAWFTRAEQGTIVPDHVLYWEAQNARGQHHTLAAVDVLDRLVRDHPSSTILPQALEALAGIALDLRWKAIRKRRSMPG
jgi:hypothetical protein